jgi:hypothetical protein
MSGRNFTAKKLRAMLVDIGARYHVKAELERQVDVSDRILYRVAATTPDGVRSHPCGGDFTRTRPLVENVRAWEETLARPAPRVHQNGASTPLPTATYERARWIKGGFREIAERLEALEDRCADIEEYLKFRVDHDGERRG